MRNRLDLFTTIQNRLARKHCTAGMGATASDKLPVVKFDRYDVSPEQRGEEGDGEVVQLVDGHLHGRFGEHLRAHVEYQTRLDYTSRHVCDWLVT